MFRHEHINGVLRKDFSEVNWGGAGNFRVVACSIEKLGCPTHFVCARARVGEYQVGFQDSCWAPFCIWNAGIGLSSHPPLLFGAQVTVHIGYYRK